MTISPALQDLVIGIVTSIITGISVWLWQKVRQSRALNANARFFNLKSGDECLVVLGQYRTQNATSHGDIDGLIEAVKLIYSIGCSVKVAPFDKTIEPPGEMTEICIAGPDSNQRTQIHLSSFLCARKGCQIARGKRERLDTKSCQRPLSQTQRALAIKMAPSRFH